MQLLQNKEGKEMIEVRPSKYAGFCEACHQQCGSMIVLHNKYVLLCNNCMKILGKKIKEFTDD